MTTTECIEHLTEQLRIDPGYRISWQANIAVQFQDEWEKEADAQGIPTTRRAIHAISNKAADNFLNLLCYVPKESDK